MLLPACQAGQNYSLFPVLGKKTRQAPKHTLVLDLDETLVHSSLSPIGEDDYQITIRRGTEDVAVNKSLSLGLREHQAAGKRVVAKTC